MARLCQICETQESKYKCPSCRAPYCSAVCYKTHKETPCGVATDVTNAKSLVPVSNGVGGEAVIMEDVSNLSTNVEADDDIDPTKLLTAEQLAGLRHSEFAKEHLAHPRVRELLTQIDSSTNRMKALEKALLDPIFSNFMFRALDEIESHP